MGFGQYLEFMKSEGVNHEVFLQTFSTVTVSPSLSSIASSSSSTAPPTSNMCWRVVIVLMRVENLAETCVVSYDNPNQQLQPTE